MNRRIIGVIAAAAIAVTPLAACGSDRNQSATAVCADANGTRLPDSACDSGNGSGNTLMWFLAGAAIGGVGTHLYGGSYNRPSSARHYYYGGVPSTGGSVPKSGHFKSGATSVPKVTGKPSTRPSASPSTSSKSSPSASSAKPSTSPSKPAAKPSVKAPTPKAKQKSPSKPRSASRSRH